VFFFSGEGLAPRPFFSRRGTRAFAIFKVMDRDLHVIFKVERSSKFQKCQMLHIFQRFFM
jgi:hypothetical protein